VVRVAKTAGRPAEIGYTAEITMAFFVLGELIEHEERHRDRVAEAVKDLLP
jgi:hypothetical protein